MKIGIRISKFILLVSFIMVLCACKDTPYFDYAHKPHSPLIGYWEVVDASKEPFTYVYCEELYIGTRFAFDYTSRMFIYNRNEEVPCTDWKFGYAFKDSIIETWEGDMIKNFDILYLTKDTMNIEYDGNLTLVRIEDPNSEANLDSNGK